MASPSVIHPSLFLEQLLCVRVIRDLSMAAGADSFRWPRLAGDGQDREMAWTSLQEDVADFYDRWDGGVSGTREGVCVQVL